MIGVLNSGKSIARSEIKCIIPFGWSSVPGWCPGQVGQEIDLSASFVPFSLLSHFSPTIPRLLRTRWDLKGAPQPLLPILKLLQHRKDIGKLLWRHLPPSISPPNRHTLGRYGLKRAQQEPQLCLTPPLTSRSGQRIPIISPPRKCCCSEPPIHRSVKCEYRLQQLSNVSTTAHNWG